MNTSDLVNQRGMELVTAGDISSAIETFRQGLAVSPDQTDLLGNFGLALLLRNAVGDVDEAIEAFEHALSVDNEIAPIHAYLGGAYSLRNEDERAIAHLTYSLGEPSTFSLRQLSLVLARNGRYGETLEVCNRLLDLSPNDEPARANRAMMLLANEQFEQGWADFEYRNHMPEERERTARLLHMVPGIKEWRGEDISGKHLLVHAEGGMGDSLQFCRFIPDYAAKCARISIYDRTEGRRLLEHSFGNQNIEVVDVPPRDADYYILMMSAGPILKLASSTVYRPPYLRPLADQKQKWRDLLVDLPSPRIGIVWAGQASNIVDARRSLKLSQVRPLFDVPAGWVSLQKELAGEQCPIFDCSPHVTDWLDTACLVAELDLVVAVDTAVAHLAGGLGKPVWVLNRFDTCWRWGMTADTTPWYPEFRIFRQRTLGDWQPVIAAVKQALMEYVSRPADPK